jgi:hypothetical protein
MSSENDLGRDLRGWMRDEEPLAADHVLDAVASQLPRVRQRRARWWSLQQPFAVPVAASALVLVALMAVGTLLGQGPGFGFLPGPTPPATSTGSPRVLDDVVGELEPGTYTLSEGFPVSLAFDVPAGYAGCVLVPTEQGLCADGDNRSIDFVIVENLVADPCDPSQGQLDPPIGPTVDDLVAGLERLPRFTATLGTPSELDGHPAQRLTLVAPTTPEACFTSGAQTWVVTSNRTNGVGLGERNELWILEVQGQRLMIALAYQPDTPPEAVSQMRDIVESVRFDS